MASSAYLYSERPGYKPTLKIKLFLPTLQPIIFSQKKRSPNLVKFTELKLVATNYDMLLLIVYRFIKHKEKYAIEGFKALSSHRVNRMSGGGTIIYVKDTAATPEQATHIRFHGEIRSAGYGEIKLRKCLGFLQVGQRADDVISSDFQKLYKFILSIRSAI